MLWLALLLLLLAFVVGGFSLAIEGLELLLIVAIVLLIASFFTGRNRL